MKIIRPALLALLLLAPAAAHADTPLDHGSFAASCAPWDGAAVRFELTSVAGKYPQIGIAFFKGAAEVKTGSYTLPMNSHDGVVNYCTSQTGCKLANTGTFELLEFTPWTSAKISYDIMLDDGTELKGAAALTGSDKAPLCG